MEHIAGEGGFSLSGVAEVGAGGGRGVLGRTQGLPWEHRAV